MRMCIGRIRPLIAVIVFTTCLCVSLWTRSAEPTTGHWPHIVPTGSDAGPWLRFGDQDSATEAADELRQTFEAAAAHGDAPRDALDLARDAAFVLTALATDAAEEYFERRVGQGWVLDGARASSLIETYERWGFRGAAGPGDGTDAALVRAVWETNALRLMRLSAVDLGSVSIETKAEDGIIVGDAAWPYPGTRSCLGLFTRRAGVFMQVEADRLIQEGLSAFVRVRVEFSDGSQGHLHLSYFWDEESSQWCPASITVGSESQSAWPWPAF